MVIGFDEFCLLRAKLHSQFPDAVMDLVCALRLLAFEGYTVGQLQKKLGIVHAAQMSRVVDKLLATDSIQYKPDMTDRRRMVVTITEQGRKLLVSYAELGEGLLKG